MSTPDTSLVTDKLVMLTPRAWRRFWKKVRVTETCWLWTGGTNPDGYGRFHVGHNLIYPHRLMSVYAGGPMPDGYVVDHLCRTPACVRPDHLEQVTMRENTDRGECPTWIAHKTGICKRGHDLAIHGYRRKSDGLIAVCRECARIRREAVA